MTAPRLFHGWWMVLAAVVGLGLGTMPLVMTTFGIFMKPLIAEFGWSRSEAAAALTFHVLGIVLAAPLAGRMVDRFGARRLILLTYPIAMALVAGQYYLTKHLPHLYASYFLTAVFGGGVTTVAYTKVICNWFERRRGLALGIALSGIGIGTAVCAIYTQQMISTLGWRETYVALAALSFLVGYPVVYLLLRDRPADLGMTTDMGIIAGSSTHNHGADLGIAPRQAWRSSVFWMMVIGFALVGLGYSGIAAHLMPLLTDRGLTPESAALAQACLGLSLVAGRLITGYLLDFIWGPLIAALAICGTAAGIGLLTLAPAGIASYVGACLVGMAAGAEVDVMAVLVSRYFGTKYFATLYGQLNSFFFLATALGPIAVGMSYDKTQSYATIAPAIMVVLMASAVLFLFFRPYPNPATLPHAR